MSAKKSLVAYYSRKGNNYVGGNIVNLPVGNTEVIAKKIQAFTGADLFEIIPVKEYPLDYTETTEVAQDELRKGLRPQITDTISDMSTYDVLFLGYPNWWGTMPMPVFTFLEGYDFSGKTIIPFCTHEGSGMGKSERDILKTCPNAKVLAGLAIVGSQVNKADKALAAWLKMHDRLGK